MRKNIWNLLEIEETTDKKAIKKAYAKKSKLIHPEEHPEAFKELYEAYRLALDANTEEHVVYMDTHTETKPKVENAVLLDQEYTKDEEQRHTKEHVVPLDKREETKPKFDETVLFDQVYSNVYEQHNTFLLESKDFFDELENCKSFKKKEHMCLSWEERLTSPVFIKYKNHPEFIREFSSYILDNSTLCTESLKMIADHLGVFTMNVQEISEETHPLYLYLNDHIKGILNYRYKLSVCLSLLTILSVICYQASSLKVAYIFLISLYLTIKCIFYWIPKYEKQETFLVDRNRIVRGIYCRCFFFLMVQLLVSAALFPDLHLMEMALEVPTLWLFLYGIFKKSHSYSISATYYSMMFGLMSGWGCLIKDVEQMQVIVVLSFIVLLVNLYKEMKFMSKEGTFILNFKKRRKPIGMCCLFYFMQFMLFITSFHSFRVS